VKDTGVYKCLAKNPGNGESEASVTITVHSDNDTSFYGEFYNLCEDFWTG
jgi:hypothetical protein